ncbi:MAG: N-acetyl sugar amidotransferase, partial [Deltaproteobacteria bacterium]|nr:N-acetyl sugar amidotransferase [Deltaproteobacteria bacterium]
MRYCQRCVLPDTRPGLVFSENGVCNACLNHPQKESLIDWSKREEAFKKIIETAKNQSCGYDAIIPVSGGKDSTWQVACCLEYGL